MLDAVQLVDFNRDAEEIESFLAQKEAQLASGSAGTWISCLTSTYCRADRHIRTSLGSGRGCAGAGDSLDAVHANQKKHDRLEQELAQEEGKLKALNNLGQAVRAQAGHVLRLESDTALTSARAMHCVVRRCGRQRRLHS